MRFTPKTDEQIAEEAAARMLWEEGIYSFEILESVSFGSNVISAEEKVSKSGNDMMVLPVKLFHDDGRETVVIDYITEAMSFKLKHLCEAVGFSDRYQAGEIHAADLIGKCGSVSIGRAKGKPKNDGSGQSYPDKNTIVDYVVKESGSAPVTSGQSVSARIDDTIPF